MSAGSHAAADRGPARSGFRRALWGCTALLGVVGVALVWTPFPGCLLGALLLVPVALVLLGAALSWFRRRFLWKVRRRLFVSFLFIGVAPLLLSLALTLVVEAFYWIHSTASIATLMMNDVGTDLAQMADTIAIDVSGKASPKEAPRVDDLIPAFFFGSGLGNLKAQQLAPEQDADPLDHDARAPAWMKAERFDGRFVRRDPATGKDQVVWAAIRPIEGGDRRLLLTTTLDEGLSDGIFRRTGISIIPIVLFIPKGSEMEGIDFTDDPSDEKRPVGLHGHPPPRVVVQDAEEQAVQRMWNRTEPKLRYGWISSFPASSWQEDAPGDGLFLFLSSIGTDVGRLQATYSGFPGTVMAVVTVGTLTLFTVAYVVLLGIGVLLAGAVSGGIGRLYQATTEFARGNLDYRIRVRTRDQLGEVAQSLNEMAGSVQRLLRESAEKERLAQEVDLAREVQQKLLPHDMPSRPGLSVAGRLRPQSEVGGDTYDFIELSDRELLVMVADVSGHGLRPGVLAAMAKACLMTKIEHDAEHGALLSALHRITRGALDRRLFMTVMLATFDTARGTVTISAAGHPPCLRCRGGVVTEIGDSAYPLGIREERVFATQEHATEPGDVYLLVSDGLVEARNSAGEPWGYERLSASLRALAALPAAVCVDGILREVDSWCGRTLPEDDITLVVVSLAEPPSSAHTPA